MRAIFCVCMFSTTVLIMMGLKKTHLLGHTNQILEAREWNKYKATHVLVSDQQMIARIALTWPSSSRPSARVTYWPNGKILTEMAPPPQPWQLEDRSETDLACSISRQFRSQYVLHCHNLLQIFHSNVHICTYDVLLLFCPLNKVHYFYKASALVWMIRVL